jgi:hypothetical protein
LDDEMFVEDSFIIGKVPVLVWCPLSTCFFPLDDEDDAFYADIVETEVDDKVDIELLEQAMLESK